MAVVIIASSLAKVGTQLDKARIESDVSPGARMAELMRCYRSLRKRRLLERIGDVAVSRFFDAYIDGDAALRRSMERRLPLERLRLVIHTLGYRR